jgi:ligand-binding sensor domain-containing protein
VLEIDLGTLEVRNSFARADGLANEYIFAIGLDSRGYKWFGTNAGGVSRYKAGDWRTFFPMHGLADYWVYAFAEQPGGVWWIGTWDGANRVNLATLEFETFRAELVNEWVYGIAVDSDARIWFGTEGGVSMLDGEHWRHWTHADGIGAADQQGRPLGRNTGLGTRDRHDLSVLEYGTETFNPNYIFSLHADSRDRIWAGTWGGGVAVYEDGAWRNYTTADGLAGNLVYCIIEDGEGALWFGTDRGVSRFDGTRWQSLGVAEGLLGSHVYALAVTPTGELWAGTRHGVARIGRAD